MKTSLSIPTSPARIWIITFLYTCLVSLLVQLVLLPYVFPSWHAGNGLISGTDAKGFHDIAVRVVNEIKLRGWSAWEFRPDGSAPAGIAAAIYAATIAKPWVLIPFGAALQAFGIVMLFMIIRFIVKNSQASTIGVLPFLLFPSEISWYAQIHRDGMAILGFYCFLYSLILITNKESWQNSNIISNFLRVLFYFISGCILIWIARPYQAKIFQAFGVIFYSVMILVFLFRTCKKQMQIPAFVLLLFFFGSTLKLLGWMGSTEVMEMKYHSSAESMEMFTRENELHELNHKLELQNKRAAALKAKSVGTSGAISSKSNDSPDNDSSNVGEENKDSSLRASSSSTKKLNNKLDQKTKMDAEDPEIDPSVLDLYVRANVPYRPMSELSPQEVVRIMDFTRNEPVWTWSQFIPKKLDEQFYGVALMRNRFRLTQPKASTALDVEIAFHNTAETLSYIPRAFQIGFLAPFPVRDEKLQSDRGSTMFRIVSLEMLAVYLGLLSFFIFWLKNPRRLDTLPILLYAGGTTMILGMVVNNVGTIYRMRFAFLMVFVCLGIAHAFEYYQSRSVKKS